MSLHIVEAIVEKALDAAFVQCPQVRLPMFLPRAGWHEVDRAVKKGKARDFGLPSLRGDREKGKATRRSDLSHAGPLSSKKSACHGPEGRTRSRLRSKHGGSFPVRDVIRRLVFVRRVIWDSAIAVGHALKPRGVTRFGAHRRIFSGVGAGRGCIQRHSKGYAIGSASKANSRCRK